MRAMFWLIKERLVLWRRHPLQVLFLLGIPFLSIVLYLATQTAQTAVTIGVIDQDRTTDSRLLVSGLKQRVALKPTTAKRVDTMLSHGEVTAVVTIPDGYQQGIRAGDQPQLRLRTLQKGATVKAIKGFVKAAYQTVLSVEQLSSTGKSAQQVSRYLQQHQASEMTFRQVDQAGKTLALSLQILGFMLMMMLYQADAFGARNLQNERRNKIYQRTMLTPISSGAYFAGTAAFAMLAMTFEAVLTVVAMVGIFRIDPGISVIQLIGVLLAFGVVAVMWSLAIGVLAPSTSVASGLQTVLITVTSLLSGALIPLTVMPPLMQKLAMFTPQYWVLDAIRGLQAGTMGKVGVALLIIAAFALLFFSIAVYGFSRRKRQELYD